MPQESHAVSQKKTDLRLPYAELRLLNSMEKAEEFLADVTCKLSKFAYILRLVSDKFLFVDLCCRGLRQALTHKRACGEIGLLTLKLSCAFMEITPGDMSTQCEKEKKKNNDTNIQPERKMELLVPQFTDNIPAGSVCELKKI